MNMFTKFQIADPQFRKIFGLTFGSGIGVVLNVKVESKLIKQKAKLYARISGEILYEDTAQRYHDLLQRFRNVANFAINSHKKYDLTSQKLSTWSVCKSSSLDPLLDPLDEVICMIKGVIHSRHVSFYEDWLQNPRDLLSMAFQ
ncbi:predicted protein [Pyrenophora tritici-repentis Pt-1C-BFP]|uniref:Uncharacterized protein n=1 Tax=Pyrenophora tritici-repentis (strain Pt-1C-BFP) TaxID=426418 RepID=B2WDF0_PYRTR|nr:uncharacterized protein PTRG_08009 [Pyrenophora tritici-repentis Pt-1C-BFP]EDU50928.1 predicted protein [Pyrenophora tritici-repentis Pt-1C-BFP]